MVDARMFRSNGGCGYVKKPDLLMSSRPHNEAFNPKAKLPVKKTLKVKVYMGDGWHFDFKQTHFDLYSPPDFYTRVSYIAFLNQCSHDTTWFTFQWLTLIKTKFSSCKDRS